jgi:hypothetical protein
MQIVKYVPSATGFGQMSGSQGSTVASRNRNGSYTRNRVMPVNPRSTKQSLQRSYFTDITQLWRSITSAQRAGWTALGANIVRNDSLGQTYTLTGSQAFMSINRNLLTLGGAILSDAPAYSPPASLLSVTVTATS